MSNISSKTKILLLVAINSFHSGTAAVDPIMPGEVPAAVPVPDASKPKSKQIGLWPAVAIGGAAVVLTALVATGATRSCCPGKKADESGGGSGRDNGSRSDIDDSVEAYDEAKKQKEQKELEEKEAKEKAEKAEKAASEKCFANITANLKNINASGAQKLILSTEQCSEIKALLKTSLKKISLSDPNITIDGTSYDTSAITGEQQTKLNTIKDIITKVTTNNLKDITGIVDCFHANLNALINACKGKDDDALNASGSLTPFSSFFKIGSDDEVALGTLQEQFIATVKSTTITVINKEIKTIENLVHSKYKNAFATSVPTVAKPEEGCKEAIKLYNKLNSIAGSDTPLKHTQDELKKEGNEDLINLLQNPILTDLKTFLTSVSGLLDSNGTAFEAGADLTTIGINYIDPNPYFTEQEASDSFKTFLSGVATEQTMEKVAEKIKALADAVCRVDSIKDVEISVKAATLKAISTTTPSPTTHSPTTHQRKNIEEVFNSLHTIQLKTLEELDRYLQNTAALITEVQTAAGAAAGAAAAPAPVTAAPAPTPTGFAVALTYINNLKTCTLTLLNEVDKKSGNELKEAIIANYANMEQEQKSECDKIFSGILNLAKESMNTKVLNLATYSEPDFKVSALVKEVFSHYAGDGKAAFQHMLTLFGDSDSKTYLNALIGLNLEAGDKEIAVDKALNDDNIKNLSIGNKKVSQWQSDSLASFEKKSFLDAVVYKVMKDLKSPKFMKTEDGSLARGLLSIMFEAIAEGVRLVKSKTLLKPINDLNDESKVGDLIKAMNPQGFVGVGTELKALNKFTNYSLFSGMKKIDGQTDIDDNDKFDEKVVKLDTLPCKYALGTEGSVITLVANDTKPFSPFDAIHYLAQQDSAKISLALKVDFTTLTELNKSTVEAVLTRFAIDELAAINTDNREGLQVAQADGFAEMTTLKQDQNITKYLTLAKNLALALQDVKDQNTDTFLGEQLNALVKNPEGNPSEEIDDALAIGLQSKALAKALFDAFLRR